MRLSLSSVWQSFIYCLCTRGGCRREYLMYVQIFHGRPFACYRGHTLSEISETRWALFKFTIWWEISMRGSCCEMCIFVWIKGTELVWLGKRVGQDHHFTDAPGPRNARTGHNLPGSRLNPGDGTWIDTFYSCNNSRQSRPLFIDKVTTRLLAFKEEGEIVQQTGNWITSSIDVPGLS